MLQKFLRKKSVESILASAEKKEHKLKKSLGAIDLIGMGVGAVIGAGIFVITGSIAAGGANHVAAGTCSSFELCCCCYCLWFSVLSVMLNSHHCCQFQEVPIHIHTQQWENLLPGL